MNAPPKKGSRMESESVCDELATVCWQTLRAVDHAEDCGANVIELWEELNLWPLLNKLRGNVRIPREPTVGTADQAREAIGEALAMIEHQR